MRTTTLQSSKASSSLWKLFVAMLLVWILVPIGQASAQNKATENNGTENTIEGVDKLYGIDPSSANCTSNGTKETDGDRIVCLYNVGAKKFLSIGGKWGTHASLNVSPYSIYMRWNNGSSTYFLQNKVEGSGTGQYMGIFKDKDGVNGVFMDRNENCAIRFVKAKDYSDKNKVYLVEINSFLPVTHLGYLTAYPNDENKFCDYETNLAAEDTPEYKNQEWKVITKNEYYLLFNTAPAYMESAVDASFLITCPDFRIHDIGAANWKIEKVHYDITMVSLDRKKLQEHMDPNTWVSSKTFSGSGTPGKMVCKGTLAKTYEDGKIIDGRDDLNGAFFMYKGNLIQVPSGPMENGEPYSYGLKAFRCWFELESKTTSGSKVSLMIDGVEDSATSIDDIHGSSNNISYKRGIEGVFNMHGQMVRRDNSLEGLPKGMYVVNGKKVIIK